MTELPEFVAAPKMTKQESPLLTEEVTVECFAAACLFAERGAASDHIYQPAVNPRQMNFGSYICSSKAMDGLPIPPVVWSMMYPSDASWFSRGNLIALYPYEVFGTEYKGARAQTGAPLTYSVETNECDEVLTDLAGATVRTTPGNLRNTRVGSLTANGFVRTLQVFNLRRHEHYEGKPDVYCAEVASFLQCIGEIKLGTLEGLKLFIERFELSRFLTLDEDVDFVTEQKRVSKIVRALCPFRLAAYDGRHRFNLCCHFFHGLYYPTNESFPDMLTLEEVSKKVTFVTAGEKETPKYEACELFKEQKFLVTLEDPGKKITFDDVMHQLKKDGTMFNESQRYLVHLTWPNVASEVFTNIIEGPGFMEKKAHDETFWTSSKPLIPFEEDMGIIMDYAEEQPGTRIPLYIGQGKLTFKALKEAVASVGGNYTYPLGYIKDAKPVKGLPKDIGIIAALVKMLGHDPSNYSELRNLFQQTRWTEEQGPIDESDREAMRSLHTLQQTILYPVASAVSYLTQKYVVERYIMDFCVTANGREDLAADLQNHFGFFPKCNKVKFFLEQYRGGGVTDQMLTPLNKNAKRSSRLQFALHATLLANVLKMYNKYGPNFQLKHIGTTNQEAVLYLR
jgi:hypothetical protein